MKLLLLVLLLFNSEINTAATTITTAASTSVAVIAAAASRRKKKLSSNIYLSRFFHLVLLTKNFHIFLPQMFMSKEVFLDNIFIKQFPCWGQ
jgi:hypothetical protein